MLGSVQAAQGRQWAGVSLLLLLRPLPASVTKWRRAEAAILWSMGRQRRPKPEGGEQRAGKRRRRRRRDIRSGNRALPCAEAWDGLVREWGRRAF